MPDVLSTSRFTPAQLRTAIAKELETAPANAITADVTFNDGTVRSTVALKIDRDRWVIGVGGFYEHPKDGPSDFGAYGSVTVRF